MATDVKQMVGNYAESLWYCTVDSSGYVLSGTSTTAPTAGNQDGSAMTQLVGLQDFPFEPVDPDRPTQRGDGGALARFLNKPTELPEANMTFGAGDYTFDALVQSLYVISVGGGEFIGRQPETPTFTDMMLMPVAQAKDLSGNSIWEARIIYKTNIYSKGRGSYNDNALPTYTYSMVANYATAYPWGTAFVAGTDGDTKFVYTDFTWQYRPIFQRYTGNNSETTFNLAKDIAEDSNTNIVAYVNGTAVTWVTGAPSPGEFGITEGATDTIVFGTAPGTSGKVVVLYGWH